jgi:hypothetical protein
VLPVGRLTALSSTAVFRTAIVFLQLFERYRREPGPNLGCIGFDTIGRDLLDYAFDIARGRAE